MDVTPRELRDIDITSEFRGYCREEVNDLLERAAATIEGLSERVRMLSDRLTAAQHEAANRNANAEPTRTLELAQRTLEMAQKTADDELTKARETAATLVRDAELRANSLVGDAEVEARTRVEAERRRLHEDVSQLLEHRDSLRGEVGRLEQFETDYRDRLVRAIEADLAVVRGRSSAAPGPWPETTVLDTDLPVIPAGSDTDADRRLDEPVAATGEQSASGTLDLSGAEEAENATADDAFLTSLREAVSDDTPLEPGEERFFEAASPESSVRDVFRRRR